MSLIELRPADGKAPKTLEEINEPLHGHLEQEHLTLGRGGIGVPLPKFTDPRMVSVVIPDDDRCETTLRYCAEKMCTGRRVAILEIPTIIPEALMPQLMDKLNEMCRDAAGQVQGHLSRQVTVVRTSTERSSQT